MKRFKILHETSYAFSDVVSLLPHTLRLRPREGHELRIEKSELVISPDATVRWHRDVEGNSVAIANFSGNTRDLEIKSEVILQQYDQKPYDFLVAEYAVDYPFKYPEEDRVLLSPYMGYTENSGHNLFKNLVDSVRFPGEEIQSFALLIRLNQTVYRSLSYNIREEEGVQYPEESLALGTGSCRDFANLFLMAARKLGFAARFVSGYVYSYSLIPQSQSTHAWAEVFLPGAGWKGFDQTTGDIVSSDHIAVAVARLPESVPPVSGSFLGLPGSTMTVNVHVSALS